MRQGASLVWHHSLPRINSFNKTEAAVFSCRLCFLRAFPFISLFVNGEMRYFLFYKPSMYTAPQRRYVNTGRETRDQCVKYCIRLFTVFVLKQLNSFEIFPVSHNQCFYSHVIQLAIQCFKYRVNAHVVIYLWLISMFMPARKSIN